MRKNVVLISIALLVALAGIAALYFKKPVSPVQEIQEQSSVQEDKIVPLPQTLPKKSPEEKPPAVLKVGILGESRSDGSTEEAFNKEVLGNLLHVLDERQVQAIFFTGNQIYGWSALKKKPVKKSTRPFDLLNDPKGNSEEDNKGDGYEPDVFRRQLKQFHAFVQSTFSYPIAIYPAMGTHEAIGEGAEEIFQEEFQIQDRIPSMYDGLGYFVPLGNAFFVVISTNYYDTKKQRIIEHSVSPEMLFWLDSVLREAKKHYRFLFVLGHEPAYSTLSIYNKASGLDRNLEQRDAFWGVLKTHGVAAYFSSHEHVYDRSNRDGVWQVVSGGGGSPLNNGEYNLAFFHCLLLTVPQNDEEMPAVTVLDSEGRVRDHFELNQNNHFLHQFRIF